MLHFKHFGLLKNPTIRRNCIELTSINNEEIVYTLLNISKYQYNTKKKHKQRKSKQNSNSDELQY